MWLLSRPVTVAVLLGTTGTWAYIREQSINTVSFDQTNATVTVRFDGFNVTESFSNSSEANTPWEAELKVRANVHDDEQSDNYDPDDDKFDYYRVRTQFSLTYDLDGNGDADEPDDTWALCAGIRPLYNMTLKADEDLNTSCEGLLSSDCIQWLQRYVDDGGPCRSPFLGEGDVFINDDLKKGPCSDQQFPVTREGAFDDDHVPRWLRLNNLTLDAMEAQWESDIYKDEDDTDQYDEAVTRVFLLLASWAESGNKSNNSDVNLDSVLNGTVLCLRPNETDEGSRTLAEVAEDAAVVLGGRCLGLTTMAIATLSAALLTFAL